MSERINLTEIEARCEAASPGPWTACTWDPMERPHVYADVAKHNKAQDLPYTHDDSQFIAHARTDLPALVAWVREACGALAIAKRDAEREGWDARASAIDALLSRLEVERP